MKLPEVIDRLDELADPEAAAGMSRYGIKVDDALGIAMPKLRALAKSIGRDHELAGHLWKSKIHEARLLAALIDDPEKVTDEQMENWVTDFDSWDVCDVCVGNLFDRTSFAYTKAHEWSARDEEFVKRAGFVMVATLAVHDKQAPDDHFLEFLEPIAREASDERKFVKKAISWALRQIGKRNKVLYRAAMDTAAGLRESDSGAARWVAADAIRELNDPRMIKRIMGWQE